jgi:hypothetical protein
MHVMDLLELDDPASASKNAQNALHVGAATPSRLFIPYR